ncbi:putative monooxygenase [Lindgomyces ingoldianus]|uniref:Monooxygenase n=1 Tax=Lindgomyces ingoldianus TaxID=673940 RepID=A0ACB6QVB7_9PLEO|nr:putative monooxygenase [Lindgomyces ingoldianus]KAF2470017.1 putative monooxygenase [Lindgomyces ingoldianus]
MTPPIAILGAGPSGLTLGRLLQVANIPFVIFEQDESAIAAATVATGRGGALDIHADSGQIALKEAGLLDQFKSIARYDATITVANAKGKVYLKVEHEGGDNDKPEIDRRDLRALLVNSIPANRVQWGFKVQSVQKETDGSMSIHFQDGRIESGFKLVVGADGMWSKVRSLVTSAKPQYSGIYYLTTAIQPESPFHSSVVSLAGNGLYMAIGDGKQIVILKLGDGSYYIGFGLRLPENWSSEQAALIKDSSALRQWLLSDGFADWPEAHTDVIRHSDGDFYVWPLYAMPTESLSWQTVPGVTLIGDAAHVTTPFVGEGVNCALYDSLRLAQQIIKHGLDDLHRAVSEYEASMLPRGIDLIERSTKSGELYFASDAPKGWLKTFAGIDIA